MRFSLSRRVLRQENPIVLRRVEVFENRRIVDVEHSAEGISRIDLRSTHEVPKIGIALGFGDRSQGGDGQQDRMATATTMGRHMIPFGRLAEGFRETKHGLCANTRTVHRPKQKPLHSFLRKSPMRRTAHG